ncbi:ribokinase [uncultured Roseobacter sp.]|uniref:ribokinase n=1 Tax=uncultured Roseobacter sp. TaxID=114847 RepID=UPI002629109E|nr:ribokinase [uncultured Roseobacter sp.]
MSLLVAGSLHLDVVVRAPRLPEIDETLPGHSVEYVFGGKGGNQAVAAARMGADVHFAGCAGNDRFGDMLRDSLQRAGPDLSQLQTDEGPSGMSTAIVDDQGDYGAVIVTGANARMDAEAVTVPPAASLVLLQNELPESVNLTIARKARAAGVPVWLNAAPARPLCDDLRALVDLLIVNRVEAAFYAESSGATDVLRTLGAEGVEYKGIIYPAFVTDVVSTHGAGDMFVGALAARIDAGAGIKEALAFAQGAASLHVSARGQARDALDHLQVDAFLAAQSRR